MLLTRLGYEQYMTSRLVPAIATVSATFPLWQGVGDDTGLSMAHDSCAVMEYYNARRGSAQTHAERAAGLAGPAQPEFGRARATQAYLAYMRGDVQRTLACASDASRIAAEVGDDALALRSRLVGPRTSSRWAPTVPASSSCGWWRRRATTASTRSRPRATRTWPTSTWSSAGSPTPSARSSSRSPSPSSATSRSATTGRPGCAHGSGCSRAGGAQPWRMPTTRSPATGCRSRRSGRTSSQAWSTCVGSAPRTGTSRRPGSSPTSSTSPCGGCPRWPPSPNGCG